MQTSLGNALIHARGYQAPETSVAFARARELASQMEDPAERFSAYYGIWVGHHTRGEPEPLREMADLFLREATAGPDCPEALIAHRISGSTCFYFGDFVRQFDRLAEMGGGLLEGRTPQGLVASLAPPFDRRLVEPGLG